MAEVMKRFIGLNAMSSLYEDSRIEMSTINSGRSLLDFDSVIVNPELFFETFIREGIYKDIPLLNSDDSRRIVYNYYKIKEQLQELLQQGKNIYVIVGHSSFCYRYKERLSSEFELFDLYSFLPIKVSLDSVRGSNVTLVNPMYKEFFSTVNELIEYHSVINVENGVPILKIKGTNKVVATMVPRLNGNIIFLPYFFQKFFWYNDEGYASRQKFFNAVYSLDEMLTKKNTVEYPEWIDDYNILSESEDLDQLQNLEKEKAELQKRIGYQKDRLELLKKYKGLFTSTGNQLENIVKEVFGKMGFQMFPTEKGRTDVVAKYGDTDVVMEIKGLTKSAAEKNAAQLEKWASDFIDKNEKSAKPLLIVNAFRELPLEQRTEAAFPTQMLSYSKSRNHCLITTTRLLCLFIEITENPKCKDERINELLTTVGVYERYSDYTNFIKKVK